MSSFTCEHCGKSILDNGGYITGCEHYPAEGDEMKDELGERLDREIRLYQSPANKGGFMEPLKGLGEYEFYPVRLKLLTDLKAERDRLREALEYYACQDNWGSDSWGVKAVIDEYGKAGDTAEQALKQTSPECRPDEDKDATKRKEKSE